MSSQGRTTRQTADYYATPAWAIDELLPALTADAEKELGVFLKCPPLTILDPCAGGDAKRGMAYPEAIGRFTPWNVQRLVSIDIRDDSRADILGDYLKMAHLSDVESQPDLVISNPPFNLAVQFIRKALLDVRDGGLVVMLQRLNFLGSESRLDFWRETMPVLCYVHSRRMRFLDGVNPQTGKPYPGDSIEYAHFVWQRGNYPQFTKLRVL